MKLSGYLDAYYTHSANASAVARQVAFASIAAIWIFSTKTNDVYNLPEYLWQSSRLLILGLTFDLLQYVISACIWGIFHRYKECNLRNQNNIDADISSSPILNWPAIFFFWSKLLCILAGNIYLLFYLYSHIKHT